MPGRARWWRAACGALLCALLIAVPVLAEDDEPASEGSDDAVPVIPDDEARELAKELNRASRKRKAEDVLPALETVGLRSHPELHKPLLKLLTHDSEKVALQAAEILRVQKLEDAKDRRKLADSVWKYGWLHRANDKRYAVKGRVVLVMAALEEAPLEAREFKEVEKLWRWLVGNPDPAYGPALVDLCSYVRQTQDKRLCRWMAEEIDEPAPVDVNSGSNPPAEWWERRWKLWKEIKAACVETLEALTGEVFKTTTDAKAWFEAHEKDFGFKW